MEKKTLNCPSSRPEAVDAKIFAVVIGSVDKPQVKYLKVPVEVTDEVLASTGSVSPTEVFRFSSQCAEKSCGHYDESIKKCTLVERTVKFIKPVSNQLVACAIRKTCVWWDQQGKEACLRCSQVVRDGYPLTKDNIQASIPPEYQVHENGEP